MQYEILNNLQKAQKSFHIETVPPLKLAPPAIYHEKIQKRTTSVGEPSKHSVRTQKPQKIWQMKEQKSKQTGNRHPHKSSVLREFIFPFTDIISMSFTVLMQLGLSVCLLTFFDPLQVSRRKKCCCVKYGM